jgi:ferric-dicitrate binding protein FerR (iron transport regulator)
VLLSFAVCIHESKALFMEEYIEGLIVRHLSGETTPEEEARLSEWLMRKPSNRTAYEEYKQLWQLTHQPLSIDPRTEDGWQAFARQAFDQTPAARESARPRSTQRTFVRWPAYAVAAAVTLLLCAVALLFTRPESVFTRTFTHREIRTDSIRQLTLPDGTLVWLNRRSTLRYPRTFASGSREVDLEGEAFFAVKKDTLRPFRILARRTVTRVLGTSFNVRAYPQEPAVQVVVATGKVRLSGESPSSQAVQLTPGWTGTCNSATGQAKSSSRSDPNYLSWKTGRLAFENVPLAEVLPALSRHYGIPFSVQEPGLASRRITTVFDRQPLTEILEEITLLLDLEFRREKDRIIFTASTN